MTREANSLSAVTSAWGDLSRSWLRAVEQRSALGEDLYASETQGIVFVSSQSVGFVKVEEVMVKSLAVGFW